MSNCKKPTLGIPWGDIFKRRPELAPPGYEETVQLIKQQKEEQSDGEK